MKILRKTGLIVMLTALTFPLLAKSKTPEIALNDRGKQQFEEYSKQLKTLREQVIAASPKIDAEKQKQFLAVREQWNAIPRISDDTKPAERKRIELLTEKLQADSSRLSAAILTDIKGFLVDKKWDPQLMKVAILTHATPRGFAEFAQQGAEHKKLLDDLLANTPLMRQVLEAGGANGGAYGNMMQVYNAILAKSERAQKTGSIFQRLALGMAMQMPWTKGKPEAGVHGIVYRTRYDVDQVKRYLHFEKAHLDGELDKAFPDLNTWECRFIGNGQYSEQDMAWFRKMLRTYRPDHIRMKDYKWRYIRMIKSDVPYCSTTNDPSLGFKAQEHIALGGICGRRAFLGRLTTRSFGIPSRASTQSGHGAMSHWTPEGWVVCLGAWWSQAWCGPQSGLDFLLDSQAREFDDYQLVRKMQWLGDTFAEKDVSIRPSAYGKSGGFWDSLAFVKKEMIVEKAKVEALELVGGMKLGESDELIGDETGDKIEIPEKFKQITTADDGVISIPAVSCYSPRKPSDRVLFLKSWEDGYQLHYSRLGQRPELFKYRVEAPADGEYELTCEAATVSPNLQVLVRTNRDEPVPFAMPYTKGMWLKSDPIRLKLSEGRNVLSVTARTPNRGVSIKKWILKPVK